MQRELIVKVFKLKSGEMIIANVVVENSTMFNVEFPAAIQLSNNQLLLSPFIPAFIENLETLTKNFLIEKSFIWWNEIANKQLINIYSDFMLKVQSSFSNIQVVPNLHNLKIGKS